MGSFVRHNNGWFAACVRFCTVLFSALRHPERPPILSVRFMDARGVPLLVDDPHYVLAIAYNLCVPRIELVTVPPRYWHRSKFRMPSAAAWQTWRFVPTGEYIARCASAGVPIGTFHSHGIGALVTQGYDHREAEQIVRAHRAAAVASA